ncbi:CaiB/BaiF CoA transferase family protein [Fulvivirga sedimenti]|uniref:CoA transferase n=1 Tax=Fulvivirga sedimenti TaxID=2879465 RepID=A0A9X1HKM2_9BACT|nr:CaiB/BaiF CoA-transferase family protein [Fulvivirga sedimenti]MCA6073933.1 CoA transferase [Fulvivirga sedimenti]
MFEGLVVIELASVLAGPAVGQFFTELGATVIKVENHRNGGDVTRSWRLSGENGAISAYFSSVNWGKKSIGIDLSTHEGREIVYELVKKADIVLASYRAGSAEKLGMDYKTLSTLNPSLLYGSITGYGKGDPRVGYDALIQAESGFMHINGEKGADPLKLPVALIDILAAHHLKEALLLAYIQRERSGSGGEVTVSLWDAALSSLANQGANFLVAGHEPAASGSLHPNIAPYGEVLVTEDGERILLAVGTDSQFQHLLGILGLGRLLEDERFRTNSGRVSNRTELGEALRNVSLGVTADVLLNECNRLHIPAGRIRKISEAMEMLPEHMSLKNNGFSGIRTFFDGNPVSLSPPPLLGANSKDILNGFLPAGGFDFESLRARNVIY